MDGTDGTAKFPRTSIGGVSVPRMIIGTNWFLGFSHTSLAKDRHIKETMTRDRIAGIIQAFMEEGVDAIMGQIQTPLLKEAIGEAEQRTGRPCTIISTPTLNIGADDESMALAEACFDREAELGAAVCMPHQSATDALLDFPSGSIRNMDRYCRMIRERAMVPGLSTHMPAAIVFADRTGLDVETYLSIYNAAGFLMQLEADWTHRIIWNAKHPVIAIKPLAAGRLLPLVGLAFAWATLRDSDMVAVGTSTPDEAREVIELSRSILERRPARVELQTTRSKQQVR